jgi:hypothetical protein
VIRGDDIVINEPRVSTQYKSLVAELGLEYSPSKTFFRVNGVAEFAKRIFRNGVDLSPISVMQLRAGAYLDPFVVPSLLKRLVNLFPSYMREKIPHSVLSYFVRKTKSYQYLISFLSYPVHERLRNELPDEWRDAKPFARLTDLPEWIQGADEFSLQRIAPLVARDLLETIDTAIVPLSQTVGFAGDSVVLMSDSHPLARKYVSLVLELDELSTSRLFYDSPQHLPSRFLSVVLQLDKFGSKAMGRSRLNNRRWFVSKYTKLRSSIFWLRLRTDEKFMV